ncbi:MAG: UDP-glucose pyrophosphorylase [Armatimonadetes bacterium]|jgi:UTP--glucose-1-phosphate uridylyltransferase|nr:UDP-glucose pyrophosphorylase [Armatimonadota bacterium]
MIRKVIIPAGGLGTRLRPLTHLMPKEMLPLGGKVVLQYVLEECDAAGLDTPLLVLNRHKTALFAVGEETPSPRDPVTGLQSRNLYFANQAEQGGLAHAMLHGEAFVGSEPFAVALGDTIIHGGERSLLKRMVEAHLEHGAAATVAAQVIPDERISRYGVFEPWDREVEPGDVFRVRRIVEKPKAEEAPSNLAITARYVFSPVIFEACRKCGPNAQGEIELTQAMTWLAEQGQRVQAVRLDPDQSRLDIGNPQSYAEAFRLLAG